MTSAGDERRPLRVLAITPTGVLSGAERVLIGHAACGLTKGDEWTIAVPTGPAADRVDAEGLRRVLIGELKLGGGPRAFAALTWAGNQMLARWSLRAELRRADVIVANSVLVLPVLRLRKPSVPVVWLVHDVIRRPDLTRVAKMCAQAVDWALPVSEAESELSRRLGIACRVVRNGIDIADPPPELEPADPPVVGCTAVLTHWKGQHVLLDAVALVDGCEVELLGGALPKDDEYERRLRARAARPDLAGRVRFLGHRDDVSEVMGRWSIAVSASVEPEAGPLAVLEAMALGVPVVATDHGGAPEVVRGVGTLVPPNDPAAMASAIDHLLQQPGEGRSMAARARDRVDETLNRADTELRFRDELHDIARSVDRP